MAVVLPAPCPFRQVARAGPLGQRCVMENAPSPPDTPGAAVVFGANGALGHALTARLVASGRHAVVHAGSRSDHLELPPEARPFRFDLHDDASIAAAVAGIEEPLDLVIVATGLLHDHSRSIAPEKSWRQIDGAAMAEVLYVNAVGPALIARHCLSRLARNRRAVFAALSARVGSITDNRLGGWHAYRAGKAALNMLVRNFAIELGRTHPMAIAASLHPGTVDSRLSAPFQRGVVPGKLFSPDQSAGCLLSVIDGLGPADSGGLFAWNGERLEY